MSKRSPTAGELPFEYDLEPARSAYRLPLAFRCLCARRGLSVCRKRAAARAIEDLDDFDRLGEDAGPSEMPGHEIPSPEAA